MSEITAAIRRAVINCRSHNQFGGNLVTYLAHGLDLLLLHCSSSLLNALGISCIFFFFTFFINLQPFLKGYLSG